MNHTLKVLLIILVAAVTTTLSRLLFGYFVPEDVQPFSLANIVVCAFLPVCIYFFEKKYELKRPVWVAIGYSVAFTALLVLTDII
jgi:hypothetical protein